MKRHYYIIAILLIITWAIEDIYHLAPSNYKIAPFLFSDRAIKIRAYIYDITSHLQYIMYLTSLLIMVWRKNEFVKDVIIMTIILKSLSLYWYLSKYGNPHYHSEWILVSVTAVIIFICLEFLKWHGRNSILNSSD